MSAFMCSDKHFRYMVGAYNKYACEPGSGVFLQREDLDALAEMLKYENALSLASRYPREPGCMHCGAKACRPATKVTYHHTWKAPTVDADLDTCPFAKVERYAYDKLNIDPVTAIKAAKCYAYQACEHDGWETSDAKKFTDALVSVCITKIPGYDEAPWGID